MRRLLIVCATAALLVFEFSVLAIAQRSQSIQAPSGSSAPVVVARDVAVRALMLDSRTNAYLTNAGAPNRIFTLTDLANLPASDGTSPSTAARLGLVAGNGVTGSLGDGGGAPDAQFNLKLDSLVLRSGIAVGPDGTIFVADTLNSTIRRVSGSDSSEPGIVRSIAGRWGPRQAVTLSEPLGLALDRSGNLYIADRAAGAIAIVPVATDFSSVAPLAVLAHFASPSSIAVTVDGTRAFVASSDTGAIFEIDTQTRAIRVVPGFAVQSNSSQEPLPCASPNPGSSGKTAVCPAGLAVDGGGNLFVADATSGRILRVDAKTSQVTVAASALSSPGDMSFDASGNLYVAEQGANRVLKFISMGQDPANLSITPPAALPPPPAPRVCPQTAPFNFCDQPTGGATSPQPFTFTNNTNATVSGLSISFTGADPGDFQAPGNTCGTSLAANTSCTINVEFAPTATGARAATLSVTDSANDSATAGLSGTGDDYEIVLNGSPQEQSVAQGGTVTFKFNITPDSVFGGNVTIVCPASSQLPDLTTCTPSSSTVTVTPGTSAPFTVTFATTFNSVMGGTATNTVAPPTPPGGYVNTRRGPISSVWFFPAALMIFGVAAFAYRLSLHFANGRRRSVKLVCVPTAVLVFGAAALLAGCHHTAIPASVSTPIGTTNLTIQAGAQNAGRGTTIILDVVTH